MLFQQEPEAQDSAFIRLDIIGSSPTCFQEIEQQTDCRVSALFIDALERRVQQR